MTENDQKLAEVADAVGELEDPVLEVQNLAALINALGTCRLDIDPSALVAVAVAMCRTSKELRERFDALFLMTHPNPGKGRRAGK